MLPIAPIGERPGVAPVHVATVAPATVPAPPGVAVDVSPLGQLLGTLALTQKRLGELAGAAVADPGADVARLGIAAGELAETFNLARTLPLPGQGALRERLAQAYEAQRDVLAQAGIALDGERLDVDSGRLLAAFGADRQRTLAALAQAAGSFTEALPPARPDPAPKPLSENAGTVPAAGLSEDSGTVPEDAENATNALAQAIPDGAADAATRRAEEAAQAAARAAQAAELAQRQAARMAEQRRLEQPPALPDDEAQAGARRLADLQASADLESASQAALTREARQAAYRLEVAREVANAEMARQEDIATQDQRLMEARAAALRQLDSSRDEDLAAQALADRLARQRADATAARADADRLVQERLDAARRAAARVPDPPVDAAPAVDSALPPERLTSADVLPRPTDARTATPPATPAPAPNAADPAVAAAIAAQRLAGGVAGGAAGPSPAPPPRTELVPPVRPVTRVAPATPMQGGRTGPRGTG
ncbi:hypothetical protein [Pseudoduganella armeniaca]|uniref:Uncharacterized protein n=1 Tax=Pseudoduganella armeniaca TaxID=2072590 RepID=A0A2R4CFD2_9BURK|nr:hypothetical protein [Pseudoduganella armeniaca]AVR98351.1 hypothetical protein C9I28_23955 [Pseudoduganella armeniaca]